MSSALPVGPLRFLHTRGRSGDVKKAASHCSHLLRRPTPAMPMPKALRCWRLSRRRRRNQEIMTPPRSLLWRQLRFPGAAQHVAQRSGALPSPGWSRTPEVWSNTGHYIHIRNHQAGHTAQPGKPEYSRRRRFVPLATTIVLSATIAASATTEHRARGHAATYNAAPPILRDACALQQVGQAFPRRTRIASEQAVAQTVHLFSVCRSCHSRQSMIQTSWNPVFGKDSCSMEKIPSSAPVTPSRFTTIEQRGYCRISDRRPSPMLL